LYSGSELWRLRLFSFCGYGLALAALALVLFGAYDSYPTECFTTFKAKISLTNLCQRGVFLYGVGAVDEWDMNANGHDKCESCQCFEGVVGVDARQDCHEERDDVIGALREAQLVAQHHRPNNGLGKQQRRSKTMRFRQRVGSIIKPAQRFNR